METGKPISSSIGEVKVALYWSRYYSKPIKSFNPVEVKNTQKKIVVRALPMGAIYYMIPFNIPILTTAKALVNLLLGNTILMKNSETTPLTGLAI